MRASDADRERVVAFLRDRCSEGRLSADELSQRVEEAYVARTFAELESLLRDLPGWPFPPAAPAPFEGTLAPRRRGRAVTYVAVALLLAATFTGAAWAAVWTAFGLAVAIGAMLLVLGVALAPFAAVAFAAIWALRRSRRPVRLGPAGMR